MGEPSLHFVLPGDPDALTGGYIYDKRIIDGLRSNGRKVYRHLLPNGFPFPNARTLAESSRIIRRIPDDSLVVVDGLALAPLYQVIGEQASRLVLIGLIHHPLSEETGISAAQKSFLQTLEQRALSACARIVVTSSTTASTLISGYDVNPHRLTVIEPGVDPAPPALGSCDDTLNLLCVATLTPRKGHELLFNALAPLQNYSWRMSCVGDLERDMATATRAQQCAKRLGFANRVVFQGVLGRSELAQQYHSADLFVLASRYEGYGMALAEALACGLPIVATCVGAIPVTVPSNASLLVPPDKSRALTFALKRFLTEPRLREHLKAGARANRVRRRSWDAAVRGMEKQVFGLFTK